MKVGGIRRIVVPVELGYPGGNFKKLGPKPSTFAVRCVRGLGVRGGGGMVQQGSGVVGGGVEGGGNSSLYRESLDCVWDLAHDLLLPSTKHTRNRAVKFWQGERALDFVLSNQGMIDKTLLFDIELMRVQP